MLSINSRTKYSHTLRHNIFPTFSPTHIHKSLHRITWRTKYKSGWRGWIDLYTVVWFTAVVGINQRMSHYPRTTNHSLPSNALVSKSQSSYTVQVQRLQQDSQPLPSQFFTVSGGMKKCWSVEMLKSWAWPWEWGYSKMLQHNRKKARQFKEILTTGQTCYCM